MFNLLKVRRFAKYSRVISPVFYLFVIFDALGDTIASSLPVLGPLMNFAGSALFNIIELVLFLIVLRMLFGRQAALVMRYAAFMMLALLVLLWMVVL